MQEQGAKAKDWGNFFSKARLLTAISEAFAQSSMDDILNAVYELYHSLDDASEIIRQIKSEIETAR